MKVTGRDYVRTESPRSHIPRVEQFRIMERHYDVRGDVWHPGPGDDVSIADVFNDVLFSDRNEEVVEMLEEEELRARSEDVRDAEHGPYDSIVWINFPVTGVSQISKANSEDGSVIAANGYTGNAQELERSEEFVGLGTIRCQDESAEPTDYSTPACPGWEAARENEDPLWLFEYQPE